MSQFHYIVRGKRAALGEEVLEVLAGATILDNKPIWVVPGAEAVFQPMLFRSHDYAVWVMDLAVSKDAKAGQGGYGYNVRPLEMVWA